MGDFRKEKPRGSGAKSRGPEVEATGPYTRSEMHPGDERIAFAAIAWPGIRGDFDFAMETSEKKKAYPMLDIAGDST
jgi:hypothetical protein